MSTKDSLTLTVWINADPTTESVWGPADGIKIATVARKSRPACRRALALLYSCTWCLSPPSRNDAPNMNNVLVTIAPAMDAFTRVYCPARSSRSEEHTSELQSRQYLVCRLLLEKKKKKKKKKR